MVEAPVKPTKIFEVFGPFPINPDIEKVGRRIDKSQRVRFWDDNSNAQNLRTKVGCYIFAIRASKGFRPVYVGRTYIGFEHEIFGSHQRDYYNAELLNIKKGTPIMFFVVYPPSKGVINRRMIADLEAFLIQVAVAKNPNLRNVRGIRDKEWAIRGVIRSGKGTATNSSRKFKSAMGITE